MPKPIAKLLAGANAYDLCNYMHSHILAFYGDEPNPLEMPEAERDVLLIWHTFGIIGNGGFNYLFEGDLPGDPGYSLTAEAYERVGCEPAADAFRQAMNLFPGGKPPRDRDERLRIYRRGKGTRRSEIDNQFFDADEQLTSALARYIRDHAEEYKRLEGAGTKQRPMPQPEAEPEPASLDPVAVGIPELPHWARVAFAARCARHVFPYFHSLWPDALPEHTTALQEAIRLADLAAATGKPSDDLKAAALNACATAGAALAISLYGYPGMDQEPGPPDGTAATRVMSVAKAAENAAETARYPSKRSAEFALHAYAFARDIAWELNPALAKQMAEDFNTLKRAARRFRWTDRTPVPSSAFEPTDGESEPLKPWWKFW